MNVQGRSRGSTTLPRHAFPHAEYDGAHTNLLLERRLGCSEACHGYPERTTAHVRKPYAMTELHAFRISPVLATDTELYIRPAFLAKFTGHLHHLSNTFLVDRRERIILDDLQLLVVWQEATGIITAHSHGRLRQIVRVKAEELRILCNLISNDSPAGNLDHRTDQVIESSLFFLGHFGGHAVHNVDLKLQFLRKTHQRNHHFRLHFDALLLHFRSGLENGSDLHLGYFGKSNTQTTAPVT